VKSADEWGDPVNCDDGDNCQYCHTRTEQQFHPEIYKSSKCNDIQNTKYCPRGAFCAFAHLELSSPEAGCGSNFNEVLNKFLTEADQQSSSDSSSNSGEVIEWGESSRPPGPNLIQSIQAKPSNVILNGHLDQLGCAVEDLSMSGVYEGIRSRKSSGFSETLTKSRNSSGSDGDRDRNLSGNSIEQGLVSSGFLNMSISNQTNDNLIQQQENELARLSKLSKDHFGKHVNFQMSGDSCPPSGGMFGYGGHLSDREKSNLKMKNLEICRLKEELRAARAKLQAWEESMGQARTACDAWKREAALANKKTEMALREKDLAINLAGSLQKEFEQLTGHPLLRVIGRIADLPNLPPDVLHNLEWTLRRNMEDVEKAIISQRLMERSRLSPDQVRNIENIPESGHSLSRGWERNQNVE